MTFLSAAIVQKVDRPTPFCTVLSLRLPKRSIALAVIATRDVAAIGPIANPPKKRADSDAETMRWRKLLEGARVVGLRRTEMGARLEMVRAGEARAIVVTKTGCALVVGVGAEMDAQPMDARTDALDEATATALAEGALARAAEAERSDRRRALVVAIDRARKKIARRVEAVQSDLARIREADALVERGKILAAHAHAIPRGAKEATLDDWSTGERRRATIPLDPALPPRAQAEALFSRAKRMRRGAPVAEARLTEAGAIDAALVALRAECALGAKAIDDEAMAILERRARSLGARPTGTVAGKKKEREEARRPYDEYRSGERAIFVGRGAKDNDVLTTKIARPHDLFLHVKGKTGAHVVVPLQKNESCPPDLLVDAAHLAAHFSDARGEKIVDVTYAARRHVRKPRGSAPGLVVVEREKVLALRVERARMQRILSTKNT